MKFLTKERAKLGSAPGTIIQWSLPVLDNDPNSSNNVKNLPAGYLKCDGSIYDQELYPNLARIIGVGAACLYKKDDTTLLDDQFQVPDLGSKHIEATVSSNVGVYRNIEKVTANLTLQRAGVGIEVISNVGTTAQTSFNGAFTVPSESFDLNGNIGWTIPSTTEEDGVTDRAIGPHMHYANTSRVAVKEEPGFANTSRPYYIRPADGTTPTPSCNTVKNTYEKANLGGGSGPNTCNQCDDFQESYVGGQSQWPVNKTIVTMTANSWPNNTTVQVGNLRPLDVVSESGSLSYPICRNTEQFSESPPGSETTDLTFHSHRIDRNIGDTEYTATTNVSTIRPDGLTAEVSIQTTNAIKADDIVSPYFVVEYLIKY